MTCCASFLFSGFCVVLCSALQLQSSFKMLLQCLCTESEVCMRTGYELYELLFSRQDKQELLKTLVKSSKCLVNA